MKHLPSEMSGGEQQRVTIARALCNDPELLLLDEPTGDLDTRNTVDVMDLLLKVNQQSGVTCIMVTHNPGALLWACWRIVFVVVYLAAKHSRPRMRLRLLLLLWLPPDLEQYADRILYIDDGRVSGNVVVTAVSIGCVSHTRVRAPDFGASHQRGAAALGVRIVREVPEPGGRRTRRMTSGKMDTCTICAVIPTSLEVVAETPNKKSTQPVTVSPLGLGQTCNMSKDWILKWHEIV